MKSAERGTSNKMHNFQGKELLDLWRRMDWIISVFRGNMSILKAKEDFQMHEIYEEYRICICWNMKEMGFDFHVYGEDGREAAHSEQLYFYEENALKAGRNAVKKLLKNSAEN